MEACASTPAGLLAPYCVQLAALHGPTACQAVATIAVGPHFSSLHQTPRAQLYAGDDARTAGPGGAACEHARGVGAGAAGGGRDAGGQVERRKTPAWESDGAGGLRIAYNETRVTVRASADAASVGFAYVQRHWANGTCDDGVFTLTGGVIVPFASCRLPPVP